VKYHITDVLSNINGTKDPRTQKLRVIALTHDTFKYQVNRDLPRVGANHHGFLARKFTERYTQDQDILEILELHDEAYNAWFSGSKTGNWQKAEQRARKLLTRLDQRTGLYLVFFRCDNKTGDKSPVSYEWFRGLVR
jgi:hypothetical protein